MSTPTDVTIKWSAPAADQRAVLDLYVGDTGWKTDTIPFDSIDTMSPMQVREVLVDDERVLGMIVAADNGVPLPPMIVTPKTRGKGVWVVDGHHRYAAAELTDATLVDVIIVTDDIDAAKGNVLASALNSYTNGERLTSAEKRAQVLYFLDNGYTYKQIARTLTMPESTVGNYEQEERGRRRLLAMKVDPDTIRSVSHLRAIARVRADAAVPLLIEMAGERGLNVDQFNAVVSAVNRSHSDADALDVVTEAHAEWAARQPGVHPEKEPTPPPVPMWQRQSSLRRWQANTTVKEHLDGLPPSERSRTRDEWFNVRTIADQVIHELNRLIDGD